MPTHSSAIIDPSCEISTDATIGAYCIIGPHTKIDSGTILDSHVSIHGWTSIGKRCHFYSHSSVGTDPQDLKYKGEETYLEIGDDNVFREFVTLNRGTGGGRGITIVGHRNFVMAYSHIAHDSVVGNHVIMSNAATLAGHVTVEDHATIGAFSAVHQAHRAIQRLRQLTHGRHGRVIGQMALDGRKRGGLAGWQWMGFVHGYTNV